MKNWEKFELAVRNFVSALDPNATVKHNVKLPDLDTGKPRQRDVWVETTICNVFPVRVLVSCKKWSRKINQQDIDAFVGELRSSGAHKGILYTFRGYTDPAIEKARKLGISCCKLYEDEPPDLPKSLAISFYCCRTSSRIKVNSEAKADWGNVTFSELFSRIDPDQNGPRETLLERLDSAFLKEEDSTVKLASEDHQFPNSWEVGIKITKPNFSTLIIYLEGKWRIFRAKIEGHLLSGTYSFTENQFWGSLSSPWIDTQGSEPGPSWDFISDPPDLIEPGVGIIILRSGSYMEALKEHYGKLKINELSRNKTNQE